MLDIVDERERDRVVGRAPRDEVHERLMLHRAVHVVLRDGRGLLLLQKRATAKRLYPGLWTSSASGHVDAGETVGEAAVRELREELGISSADLAHVGSFLFEATDVGEREWTHVFTGLAPEATLRLDPAEVAEARWFGADEVAALVRDRPEDVTPNLGMVLRLVRDAPHE